MKSLSLAAFLLSSSFAVAETTRQLDAHEHGVGVLNIAISGADVVMEFIAPGADIVGFEYVATTDADKHAIEDALAILADPMALFTLPDAAGCSVTDAKVSLEGDEEHADHDDHDHDAHKDEDHAEHKHDEHDHDEHAEDKHDEHDHEEHAEDKHDEHDHDEHAEDKHDEHDHEEHAEAANHTEFSGAYTLTCAAPDAITGMTFPYFAKFENAKELEVQVVSGTDGAKAFEVDRETPEIDL